MKTRDTANPMTRPSRTILWCLLGCLFAGALPVRGDGGSASQFGEADRSFLLDLARKTIVQYLRDGDVLSVDAQSVPETLQHRRGCFVTLHKNPGRTLRGCIGSLMPVEPLYRSVMSNAINAATRDGRFPRVRQDEMAQIELEISVLTVPKELAFSNGGDLLKRLRPGIDGVILTYGTCRSTYLPQVWSQLPEPEVFLDSLCRKGGCYGSCWNKKGVRVETYQAEVFGEPSQEQSGLNLAQEEASP